MALELNSTNSQTGRSCPKCGYTRLANETAPDWQCPSCGIAYAKYTAASSSVSDTTKRRNPTHYKQYRLLQRLLSVFLLLSISLCLYAWFQKDQLPVRQQLDDTLFQEPVQQSTQEKEFLFKYRDTDYQVVPVADYELWGLVVTHNDIDGFMDITHDKDSVDIKDICVIWGENLWSDDYRKVEYHSGDFVCYYRYESQIRFLHNKLSNSHLLSDDANVRDKISKVNIGDQIHLKGMLVNYRPAWKEIGWRNSSTTRDDQGNGACEVVFVNEFQTLRANNVFLHRLYHWMLITISVLLTLKLIIFYRESTHIIS